MPAAITIPAIRQQPQVGSEAMAASAARRLKASAKAAETAAMVEALGHCGYERECSFGHRHGHGEQQW